MAITATVPEPATIELRRFIKSLREVNKVASR
jgi:hypothetical protein